MFQGKENSRSSSEFPNQNLRQIGPGVPELWSDLQIINKQRLLLYIHRYKDINNFLSKNSNKWGNVIFVNASKSKRFPILFYFEISGMFEIKFFIINFSNFYLCQLGAGYPMLPIE